MQTKYPRTFKVLNTFQWGQLMLNKDERVLVELKDERYHQCVATPMKPTGKPQSIKCGAENSMVFLKNLEEIT